MKTRRGWSSISQFDVFASCDDPVIIVLVIFTVVTQLERVPHVITVSICLWRVLKSLLLTGRTRSSWFNPLTPVSVCLVLLMISYSPSPVHVRTRTD